jgi:hypothetical protein
MSKYNKLWGYIVSRSEDKMTLSFEEIKDILGFEIDHSFLNYKKELLELGFECKKISLKEKAIIFERRKEI